MSGFTVTTNKILSKVLGLRIVRERVWQRVLEENQTSHQLLKKVLFTYCSNEERFSEIYRLNFWSDKESRSGPGSTLSYTQSLRHNLKNIIEEYQVKSILDAPCGDFNWMKEVLREHEYITYLGADIVDELINNNTRLYSTQNIRFIKADITRDGFPDSDLMIVRDCLFHFSFDDIRAFQRNFAKSRVRHLLTTSHMTEPGFINRDITTGDFRHINIFAEPINFPSPCLKRFHDFVEGESPKEMCLFEGKLLREYLTSNLHLPT